jgi:hypothetical protein
MNIKENIKEKKINSPIPRWATPADSAATFLDRRKETAPN